MAYLQAEEGGFHPASQKWLAVALVLHACVFSRSFFFCTGQMCINRRCFCTRGEFFVVFVDCINAQDKHLQARLFEQMNTLDLEWRFGIADKNLVRNCFQSETVLITVLRVCRIQLVKKYEPYPVEGTASQFSPLASPQAEGVLAVCSRQAWACYSSCLVLPSLAASFTQNLILMVVGKDWGLAWFVDMLSSQTSSTRCWQESSPASPPK